jgi:protein-disulfide isomerase
MRNIWIYVVGGMVAIGAIVSIKGVIGDNENSRSAAHTPAATATANAAPAKVEAPKPDASFDKVEITKNDFVLGKETAPVTLVEYASLTCPHCAQFHQNTLPAVKKEYIETGKVKLIYRDFPLDQLALSGSMIARCAGRDRYFAFIDVMFAQQSTWARDTNPLAALSRIARLGGMSQAKFDECLKDKKIADAVVQQRLDGDKKFGINATPTVIINGKRYSGGLTIEQFRAVVAPLLK